MTDRTPLVAIEGSPNTVQRLQTGDKLASAAFGLTGDPVGTTDTQTVTNKTLTAPKVDALWNGTSPSASLKVSGVASAANWLEVTNNVAGQSPRLRVAAGSSDADVGIQIEPKGTGVVSVRYAGVPYQVATVLGAEVLSNKTLVAPTIAASDWANANHTHADAAHGGQLTSSAFGIGSGVARTLSVVCTPSTAVANTVASTIFDNWSYTTTMNAWLGTVGASARITFSGKFSTTGTPTIRFTLKGAAFSTVWDSGLITTPVGVTDELFSASLLIATRTIGASGVITFATPGGVTVGSVQARPVQSTIPFDFVASGATSDVYTLRVQWGTASASNTATLQTLVMEALN